ncbi:helix-turn-helix domain-containing protein [Mesorhizobium retamae]|uniref:Helix-turn-helix domain-containing protein n=1 Tax=Mesorhizobium retamae TaxID=2912854 RepID=A0ABS9QHV5_9HYPH|nr:helix-turn-helix domain-containing protein [Mesorhizobium sp. IRAMC:0171]MCG7507039.1 helix-turn-helix domain-containing protein [Mesorhizobium sp. IRAMC:0171]
MEAVLMRASCDSDREAARRLGCAYSTLQNRLKRAAERGLVKPGTETMPGYVIKSLTETPRGTFTKQVKEHGGPFEVPQGHIVKGVSSLVDGDGRVVLQWNKTALERSPVDLAEVLKKAFEGYEPAAPVSEPPAYCDDALLTLIPCNDWHVGMFAWHRETDTNWDLKISEREIGRGIEDAIARSPRAGTAIVLGGGDLTHADNHNNETERSHNKLDVDGRHTKTVEVAGRLMARTIDAALRHNGRVIVRNLKGNHDKETAPAVAWYLAAWYRNDPRVYVDLDLSLFFYHQHGKVMLAATHGHEVKLRDMPQVMASRRAEMWGATKYRYAHGFHVHHKSGFVTEGGGVVCESHQAPIPADAWHYGAGFSSGRSLQTITYHSGMGEISRVRVAMMDTPVAANDNQPERRAA